MHDIDRIRLDSETQFEQWESRPTSIGEAKHGPCQCKAAAGPIQGESFEFGETEAPLYGEVASVFGETEEMELASEVLGVNSEQELDQFLSRLIRGVGQAIGRPIGSSAGQAIGGLLKGAARRAFPGIGSGIAGQAASALGRLFGLELEGLSGEDQEFEGARRYVRFSGEAVKNLAHTPPGGNLLADARRATIAAAQKHAPGLVQSQRPSAQPPSAPLIAGSAKRGHWMRRGNKIVVFGL